MSLKTNSQNLRKNMTPQEKHLWYDFLKSLPVTVNRQKVIGIYIVDFYCATAKTVIEIDGSQHYFEAGETADKLRDEYLRSRGITVLRYSNHEVDKNFDNVCKDIYNKIFGRS